MIDAIAVLIIVAGGTIYSIGLRGHWADWQAAVLVATGAALWVVAGPTILIVNHAEAICEIVGPRANVPCR